MERRIGIAIAAATTLVVLAATLAIGANLGVFRSAKADKTSAVVGSVSQPVPDPVITVEVRDPAGNTIGRQVVQTAPVTSAPAQVSSSSDDQFEDESSDDDREDEEHEAEDEEHDDD